MDARRNNESERGPGRPRIYDWEARLACRSFVLRPGIHYAGRADSVIQQLRNAASKLSVGVRTTVDEAGCIRVKVIREEPADAGS